MERLSKVIIEIRRRVKDDREGRYIYQTDTGYGIWLLSEVTERPMGEKCVALALWSREDKRVALV